MTKKRYCGVDEQGELHATGLEMKRTDWTPLAQNIQENLLKMVLIQDATEDQFNAYIQTVKNNIIKYPVEDFIFEKIVDCRKEIKAKTKIVKAWEACGYEVKETEYEDAGVTKKKYQCIAPRGEVLLGIKWVNDNKGRPIAIPEDEVLTLLKDKIGYDWYVKNQVIPIAERIANSISYRLGMKQKDLFGETIYV